MTADRDDNARAMAGDLPDDPRADAEPMAHTSPTTGQPWPDLIPLERVCPTVPPFPVEALGTVLGPFVDAVACSTQTAPDLAALGCLACLAATCAKRATVEIRPDWREPLNLYVAVVARSGEGKSPVHRAVFDPLRDAERRLRERMGPVVEQLQTDRRVLEKRARAAEDRAAKTGDPADLEDARALALELAAFGPCEAPRLIADDATPEKLAGLLAASGERLAVISEESAMLQADRYSKVSNLDLYLKGADGGSVIVDRMGRPGEYLRAPLLTVVLSLQPVVADALADDPERAGRGLPQRFLFGYPDSRIGFRDVAADRPVPPAIRDAYARRLDQLADPPLPDAPVVLTLSAGALEVWNAYRVHLEARRRPPTGDLSALRNDHPDGWLSKSVGTLARLAGLLHVVDHGPSGRVERGTMVRAVAVVEWALPHALKVFGATPGAPGLADARKVLRRIRALGLERTCERDLTRAVRLPVDVVRAALDLLERANHARPLPPVERGGPGRRASRPWEIHPLALHGERDATSSDAGGSDDA